MNRKNLLKKTMAMAKTGDKESFENFYILTISDAYGKVFSLIHDQEQSEEIIIKVYSSLYHGIHTLPAEEEELEERIEEEIYRLTEKSLGSEPNRLDPDHTYEKLNEERAATIWLKLEEAAGMGEEEQEEELGGRRAFFYGAARIVLTIVMLFITVFVFYQGIHWLVNRKKPQQVQETVVSTEEESVQEEEREEGSSGWSRDTDGKLFYITKKGKLADGQKNIGKQTLTFSRNGELTLIGNNRTISKNANLSFDEDTIDEVRGGNIYRSENGNDECVIRNGHVVQADFRCGYLWYICKFQIPNTERTKTTIYRSLANGSDQEELYTTDSVLETDGFQVTGNWLYYRSDGKLFRRDLKENQVEYLMDQVEYYFAFEDTAYYMKERTLESVSQGSAYSGTEAGYWIERTEQGFLLFDASGNAALEQETGEVRVGDRLYRLENGVIASVGPSDRTAGDVTYYMDEVGSERKIYWKSDSGSGGLLRQEGLTSDSFCIAGEWLYYSARTAQYGEECESRIYRVNLQSMEMEAIGEPFRGFMRRMYYFETVQGIYAEYLPSVADPEDIHGEIAQITEAGVNPQNDQSVRPEADGSDMLELVMADSSKVYCLYHRCSYDSESGQMVWQTTEPLEINIPTSGIRERNQSNEIRNAGE